jgi:hypothetical protein
LDALDDLPDSGSESEEHSDFHEIDANSAENSELSDYEGTCGFKGRVVFRVYNKDKPKKWGIKLNALCATLKSLLALKEWSHKKRPSILSWL